MSIDLYTIQLAMTTVTIVAGVMFILDAFLRRTDRPGRIWAIAFMAGILAAFSYATWTVQPDAWWAVAVGNAAMVLVPALLWSGSRAFNGRSDLLWVDAAAAAVAAGAVVADGRDGGDWAGAVPMFALIAAFAALAAAESLREPMRGNWPARGLTVIFIVVAAFYGTRAVVLAALGPEHLWFRTLLGTEASAFVLIALVIVALVSLVILQNERMPRRSRRNRGMELSYNADAVLNDDSLREIVEDWLERANFHDEQLVFMRVELDDLTTLNTAFGRPIAERLLAEFAAAVRRYASPHSDIGAIAPGVLIVVAPFERLEQAAESAEAVQQALRRNRIDAAEGLRLSASIGLAGTDYVGYDYDDLMRAAAEAAGRAHAKGGDAVSIAV